MPITLQDAIEFLKGCNLRKKGSKKSVAKKLLGQFEGTIPENKTSTQYLREQRDKLYGKTSEEFLYEIDKNTVV